MLIDFKDGFSALPADTRTSKEEDSAFSCETFDFVDVGTRDLLSPAIVRFIDFRGVP